MFDRGCKIRRIEHRRSSKAMRYLGTGGQSEHSPWPQSTGRPDTGKTSVGGYVLLLHRREGGLIPSSALNEFLRRLSKEYAAVAALLGSGFFNSWFLAQPREARLCQAPALPGIPTEPPTASLALLVQAREMPGLVSTNGGY